MPVEQERMNKMAEKSDIKKASVFACEKRIVSSDGVFYESKWDERNSQKTPVLVRQKSVRGTISNRLIKPSDLDPMKISQKLENANLQIVDSCYLKDGNDTLIIKFSVKFLGGVSNPCACNCENTLIQYKDFCDKYREKYKFEELAFRYAYNIVSARFLWRNRVGASQIEVSVKNQISGEKWNFDAKKYSLRNFPVERKDEELNKLAAKISEAFSAEDSFLILEIICCAKIGKGQEVYPSEEMILDIKKEKKNNEKSKILYVIDETNTAGMHSQKIGNAIRTIDTWYPDFNNTLVGPIAVEPYGAVTNLGRAFRAKNGKDFYSFFDKIQAGEKLGESEMHYVMAVFIRGGVFGESGKE